MSVLMSAGGSLMMIISVLNRINGCLNGKYIFLGSLLQCILFQHSQLPCYSDILVSVASCPMCVVIYLLGSPFFCPADNFWGKIYVCLYSHINIHIFFNKWGKNVAKGMFTSCCWKWVRRATLFWQSLSRVTTSVGHSLSKLTCSWIT